MGQISVVVACYNVEQFVARCIESIIHQTYENLEIILVNDGSVDATGTICEEYAQKDSRIVLINQENRGLSAARNAGLKIAKGEYIGYVDGDDYIDPCMYEKMISACIREDAQLSVCGYANVDMEGNEIGHTDDGKGIDIVLDKEELIRTYICDNRDFHIYNSVWSKLFRRDLIDDVLFPEGRNSEDIVYTMKAFLNLQRGVFVDKPLYKYVTGRTGSIMNSNQKLAKRRFEDELPFWKEQTRLLDENGLEYLARLSEYYLYKRELFYFQDFKRKKQAADAEKLCKMLKNEKRNIELIYNMDFAQRGDKARMKLFLANSSVYYFIMKLYESVVVPIKNKI